MNLCPVVNLHRESFDIYIGRGNGSIFGNPFSHLWKGTMALVVVADRETAVAEFDNWLNGDPRWKHIDPARRQHILNALPSLAGKRLGCFCHPLSCHGDPIARRVNALGGLNEQQAEQTLLFETDGGCSFDGRPRSRAAAVGAGEKADLDT